MSFSKFTLSKTWESADDFPTYEDSEEQVRSDMQCLFDELKDDLNQHVDEETAANIPFVSSEGVGANNVQTANEVLHEQIEEVSVGVLPDGSVTNAKIASADTTPGSGNGIETEKIKNAAISTEKIADGAVTTDKLAAGSVTQAKLANGAVGAAQVADGTLTSAKFAANQVATLDANGKVAASTISSLVVDVTADRVLAATDAGKLLRVNSASAVTITIPATASVSIPAGAEYEILRIGTGAVTIATSGVTLNVLGSDDALSSYSVYKYQYLHLKKLSLSNNWIMEGTGLAPGSVTTQMIADGAVTSTKLAVVPIEKGGHGAANATDARANLGITPANIGAVPTTRTVNSKALSTDISLDYSDVGAAPTSHGIHVTYATSNPVMDGTASAGDSEDVSRGNHTHPTDTSRAAATDLTAHTGNTSNPHSVTAAQLGVTEAGKIKIGNTEYTLQIGSAGDAAAGYITIVLGS